MTMIRYKKNFLLVFLILVFQEIELSGYESLIQSTECNVYENSVPDSRFIYTFIPSIQYTGGRGRSYNGGYASVESFLALYDKYCKSYPFFDVRLNRISNDTYASNIGVGWRTFSPNFQEMLGLNLYYDYREVKHKALQQMSLGVELLGKCWDVRGNGYWPVGRRRAFSNPLLFNFSSGDVVTGSEFRGTMWGVDVEVGRWLFCCKGFRFYGALGPYFYGSVCCDSLVGGLGRVEAWICNRFRLQALVSHDHLFGTNAQGSVYFYLPFPCKIRDCWLCLFPPVQRNNILIIEQICCFD